MKKSQEKDRINNILYNDRIEEEIRWRSEKRNNTDNLLINKLVSEIKLLGYNYNYLADLTMREINDISILKIIQKYIGKFEDEGKSAVLVAVIGKKGNIDATETIIYNFNKLNDIRRLAVFYDNALARIQDKRYISEYLKWLSIPEVAYKLPFTMKMLGKWKVNEAKDIFIKYLSFDRNNELIYISIAALSFYKDEELFSHIKNMENHPNIDVKKFVNGILKKNNKI